MKVLNTIALITLTIELFASCQNNQEKNKIQSIPQTQSVPQATDSITPQKAGAVYAEGTTDEAISAKIKHYLITDYLKDDMKVIPASDRKFQFQTVDLNNDGRQEIFINFLTPYFCGSGGCTLLLLNSNWHIITHFTVTTTPIMVEPHKGSKWAKLMVKDAGVWKDLNYKNGKYPSNPSLLPKSKYDAPSSDALVIFSDEFSPAKTFDF